MRALAVRYRLRAPDRTLEQSEIGAIRESMIAAASNVGAVLRGL
jgi:phenylalanyl-tRNA synthetase beta subunit